MNPDQEQVRNRYQEFRAAAVDDLLGGRWTEAVRGFERAVRAARETGDADLAAVALANLALAAVESGASPPVPALLRNELGRSRAATSRYFCASALSTVYLQSHDLCKAAFYARVALQAAPPRSRGSAQQSLGVVLLARGQYREALTHLRGALADWPTDKAPRALCLSALAYLWSLMGDRREAGRAIEATLFHCSHLGAYPSFYRRDVHLSLGFSRLELGDAEGALGDAVRALRLLDTEAPGSRHEHKMALYLAAESALDAGFIDSGLHYADQLQQTYYPGRRDIRGLLAAFRTSGMVNWLA